MPIEAVVSSSPCLDFELDSLPDSLRAWQADLQGQAGPRCWWIVPTSRRRRQIVQRLGVSATLLPRVLTFDGLMQHLTGYARFYRPLLVNTGRLIRIARAWRRAHGDAAPLTPGQVLQLDRLASEWRESGERPDPKSAVGKFVREFEKILKADACCDKPEWIELLVKEVLDASSPLKGIVGKTKSILFDGFHRFSEMELKLIDALAKAATVRLWLVGDADQPSYANVNAALHRLTATAKPDERPAPGPLAALGRSLFTEKCAAIDSDGLESCKAPTAAAEIEAVACQVKALMRSWGTDGRLANIAVVVPDDAYVALLRSTFASAGIACGPAAEVFGLAESRPARALLAALTIVRHGWPREALFDFLRQPLIARKLKRSHLLTRLQQIGPRTQLQRDWPSWRESWSKAIDQYKQGGNDENDKRDDDPEARQERAGQLSELVASIGSVLEPIRQMEREFAARDGSDPAKLAAAIARLLNAIEMDKWLSPTERHWGLIPAREWEIDQLAFNNLKDVLGELAMTPSDDFPRDDGGQIDVELVLKLTLAAERFQTSAEDDAGVQILRPRSIRGSRFRAIFAVGLVEGKVPPNDPEDLPADDRENVRAKQRDERAFEQQYLFTQLFESARERLILSRPEREGDAELMESPFLRRLKSRFGLAETDARATTVVEKSKAVLFADRLNATAKAPLNDWLAMRQIWKNSRQPLEAMRIKDWALPLLRLRYPADRLFSATALEKYASCPFQHFAVKTLGLDELERDETAMRAGLFVHTVLENFFKEWQALRQKTFDREQARPLFQRVFSDEWKKQSGALDSTLEHDFNKALTDVFLTVAGHLGEHNFQQVEAEWEFKVEVRDDLGRSIQLNGKIDRIDRGDTDEGLVELICDFKTGTVWSAKKLMNRIEHGRSLQLPLYGWARQQTTGIPVKHGIYLKLSRRVDGDVAKANDFIVNVGTILSANSRSAKIPFAPEEAAKKAVELAHDMREGRISLTRFDVDHADPACGKYCSARHACRQPKGY